MELVRFDDRLWMAHRIDPGPGILWDAVLVGLSLATLSIALGSFADFPMWRLGPGPLQGISLALFSMPSLLAWLAVLGAVLRSRLGHYAGVFLCVGRDGVGTFRMRISRRLDPSRPEVGTSIGRGPLRPIVEHRRHSLSRGVVLTWRYRDGRRGGFGPVREEVARDIEQALAAWRDLPVERDDVPSAEVRALLVAARQSNDPA